MKDTFGLIVYSSCLVCAVVAILTKQLDWAAIFLCYAILFKPEKS